MILGLMIERRKIREQRLIRARAKAEFRKNVLDGIAIFIGAIVCAVVIAGTVSIIV